MNTGFVLHLRPYQEKNALIDLFTHEKGRLSAVARGARSSSSPLRALLRPFVPLLMSWSGKGELVNLKSAEPNGLPYSLRGLHLTCGLYVNELLVRLLHRHDPHPALYQNYLQTLEHLNNASSPEKPLRLFELTLLDELGYGLPLDKEAKSGKALQTDCFYIFHPHEGFLEANPYSSPPSAALFSGENLIAIQNKLLNEADVLKDAKRLLRMALHPLLGIKPLMSRQLLLKSQQQPADFLP